MDSLDTSAKLLASIRKSRGALYWGGGPRPFTSLVAFLNGYAMGFDEGKRKAGIPASDLVPCEFHKFVTERFGRSFPDGGKGWMTFIQENTASELEAFELFFELRDEYDRKL